MTGIFISNLTIICSDNGLSPGQHPAIIWTSVGILLIGPPRTNFSASLIWIQIFSFKKMYLKMSSAKWHPFCLCLNVLMYWYRNMSLVDHLCSIAMPNVQRQAYGLYSNRLSCQEECFAGNNSGHPNGPLDSYSQHWQTGIDRELLSKSYECTKIIDIFVGRKILTSMTIVTNYGKTLI